ncbi:MAG: hypothetical protein AAF434_02180 [Pseudomonadota bacterium]
MSNTDALCCALKAGDYSDCLALSHARCAVFLVVKMSRKMPLTAPHSYHERGVNEALIHHLEQQIHDACQHAAVDLDALSQSYLAHMLVRYANVQDLLPVMRMSRCELDALPTLQLHALADECLLQCSHYSGGAVGVPTPHAHLKQLGQAAYAQLAARAKDDAAELFNALEVEFANLSAILQTMALRVDFIQTLSNALELWQTTGAAIDWRNAQRFIGGRCTVAADTRGWATRH